MHQNVCYQYWISNCQTSIGLNSRYFLSLINRLTSVCDLFVIRWVHISWGGQLCINAVTEHNRLMFSTTFIVLAVFHHRIIITQLLQDQDRRTLKVGSSWMNLCQSLLPLHSHCDLRSLYTSPINGITDDKLLGNVQYWCLLCVCSSCSRVY